MLLKKPLNSGSSGSNQLSLKAPAGFDLFISRLKSWAPCNNTIAVTVSLSRAGSSEEASLSKHEQTKGDRVESFQDYDPTQLTEDSADFM